MTRKNFRRIARTMLLASIFMLVWNSVFFVAWLFRMPSNPLTGTLTATLMFALTVFTVTQIVFWRRRLRRH